MKISLMPKTRVRDTRTQANTLLSALFWLSDFRLVHLIDFYIRPTFNSIFLFCAHFFLSLAEIQISLSLHFARLFSSGVEERLHVSRSALGGKKGK